MQHSWRVHSAHAVHTVMMDHEAENRIGRRDSIIELNHLFARVISSLATSHRDDGALNVDVTEIQTDLVLYVRTVLCSYAPPSSRRGPTAYD